MYMEPYKDMDCSLWAILSTVDKIDMDYEHPGQHSQKASADLGLHFTNML